ncbi:MAG: hypothetical protein CM1200mP2_44110 [Planctomycetaceae bacterium]|nr:MAG: hypothetical protein CM1200mP2_44110 [Planctomycetaceae bacterium]
MPWLLNLAYLATVLAVAPVLCGSEWCGGNGGPDSGKNSPAGLYAALVTSDWCGSTPSAWAKCCNWNR